MMKAIKLLPIGLVCLYFAFVLVLTLAFPAKVWIHTLFDDAYYYLGVARNISLGNGSLFAAPLETNGYQPLWLAILSVASFAVGADRTGLVAATHALGALAVLAFLIISRRQQGAAWPAALVVLMFPFVFLLGMETVLIFPLALLYFRSSGWLRGILASLIFLSRLDTVGLILGRVLYELVRYRKVDWRELLVLVLCIVAYVGMNLILFGTALPISGQAKAVGNIIFSNYVVLAQFAEVAVIPVITVIALIGGSVIARNCKYEAEIFSGIISLLCSASYYFVFSGYSVFDWYFWPVAWIFYWVLVSFKFQPNKILKCVAVVVVMLGASVGLARTAQTTATLISRALDQDFNAYVWDVSNLMLAEKANVHDYPASRFAMGDRAGSFGYFLDDRHSLIQTEGLVANIQYLEAMRADKGLAFLAAHKVDYFVVNRDADWMWDGGYVVADPMMAMSARYGVMLMCYPHSALVPELETGRLGLRVFRFNERVDCPEDVVRTFEARKKIYGGIHFNKPVD